MCPASNRPELPDMDHSLTRLYRRVKSIVKSLSINPQDVLDVVHDVLVVLLGRDCPLFSRPLAHVYAYCETCAAHEECNGRAFVGEVARNKARDQVRRYMRDRKKGKVQFPEEGLDTLAEEPGDVHEFLDAPARRLWVEDMLGALDRLPERERAVLLLSVAGGMDYRQISAAMDISLGTVTYARRSALRRMEVAFDGHVNSPRGELGRRRPLGRGGK